jgi:hypothetical protein
MSFCFPLRNIALIVVMMAYIETDGRARIFMTGFQHADEEYGIFFVVYCKILQKPPRIF